MYAPRPHPPLATHHADFSDDESIETTLTSLHRYETDLYHPTRVFKLTLLGLADEDVQALTDWLAQSSRKRRLAPWVCQILGIDEQDANATPVANRLPIRILSLSNHKMSEEGYEGIAKLIRGHGTLTTLDLTLNNCRVSRRTVRCTELL